MSNLRKKGNPFTKTIIYIILFCAAFFYLFPIYSAVNTSLKTNEELRFGPVQTVQEPTFDNYKLSFDSIKRPLLNTAIFTIFATAVSSMLGAMSGFYIAPQSILIPLVSFMGKIGLYDTYVGLILTHTAYGVPITTLLFKNYFDTVPTQLIESARIDGCSNIGAFFKIALPLSLPGFAVVAIFQFTNIWNEYLFGLTLTSGVESMPLTVAIANLKGTTVAAWNIQMAGLLISILPVLLMYLFFMELIVKGLLMGSVKG